MFLICFSLHFNIIVNVKILYLLHTLHLSFMCKGEKTNNEEMCERNIACNNNNRKDMMSYMDFIEHLPISRITFSTYVKTEIMDS